MPPKKGNKRSVGRPAKTPAKTPIKTSKPSKEAGPVVVPPETPAVSSMPLFASTPLQYKNTRGQKSKSLVPTSAIGKSKNSNRPTVLSSPGSSSASESEVSEPAGVSNPKQVGRAAKRVSSTPASPAVQASKAKKSKGPAILSQSVSEASESTVETEVTKSKKKARPSKIGISTPSAETSKLKKLYRPPKSILKEIVYYQKNTDSLIPRNPFCKLVRELTFELTGFGNLRYKAKALQALQEACENYIVGLFEDSYLITMHCKRVTMYPLDLRLAYRIRGDYSHK